MLDLSIIVPCYNVEKYLKRCIDSIVFQTLEDVRYEIILVDDASTDSTWDIIKEYEKQYPNLIIAIHCDKNGRQGTARNIGLNYAKGQYIGYVDSDDWVECDMYEEMLKEAIEYNSDIVHCEYMRDDGKNSDFLNANIGSGRIYRLLIDNNDKREEFIVSSCIGYGCVTDIIKKNILIENDILFPEKMAYEDLYWRSIVYLYVNRVSLIDKKYYHYYINYKSTVLKKNAIYHMDLMNINELKYIEYIKRKVWYKYREALEFDMLDTWYLCMFKMLAYRYDEAPYELFIRLKTRINELMPNAISNKYVEKNFSDIQKMLIELLEYNVSKKDYYKIVKIIKKIGM